MAEPGTTPRPLVGITTYGPEVDGHLASFSLPQPYVDAIAAAGGLPVLLAPCAASPDELLDALDGLVVAGGGDLDPALYHGATHETVYMVNATRDGFELPLARAALARSDVPVLGICRGMQVLNLACGGDLEVHVPDAYGTSVAHRLPPREPTFHDVRVAAGSALEKILGEAELPVCSWHHQAVRRLGEGMRAIAWAPDGVVEAIVCDAHPWALGVQWHPEMQVPGDPRQERLFAAFVARARGDAT